MPRYDWLLADVSKQAASFKLIGCQSCFFFPSPPRRAEREGVSSYKGKRKEVKLSLRVLVSPSDNMSCPLWSLWPLSHKVPRSDSMTTRALSVPVTSRVENTIAKLSQASREAATRAAGVSKWRLGDIGCRTVNISSLCFPPSKSCSHRH